MVRNLPQTISSRLAGLISRVSMVPRSFSPAHRSMAGYRASGQAPHDQHEREDLRQQLEQVVGSALGGGDVRPCFTDSERGVVVRRQTGRAPSRISFRRSR